MAKSKRQQPKRIGQSQPDGVSRATAASKASDATSNGKASATSATSATSNAKNGAANGSTTGAKSATTGATTGSNTTATSGSTRLSAMRERTQAGQRRPQQRTRYARQPWWRRNLGALITVTVIVVLIGAFVGFAQYQNNKASAGIGDPVPSTVMNDLTTVPASTFATVGTGSVATSFTENLQATAANTPLLTSNGKPEVIYVGAEYCPYCAAERWGTVIALSRFGSFSGLELTRSSSSDVYPNTPTLSFRNSTYTSKYIVFNATETTDRNQQPLATPSADVQTIFQTYNSSGSIPFLSYGNQYITVGGPFLPTMLANLDWQQVSSQLKNPKSDVSQAVIGSANYQTAMICKLTNNQPSDVCNTPVIQQIEAKLPAAK